MKTIHISLTNTKDLEQFGISVLTGERDNTMTHRLLCDLNEDGENLIARYFDLRKDNDKSPFMDSWNSMVGLKPAVSAIMLPPCMFKELVVFALVTDPEIGFVYCYHDAIWTDEGKNWKLIDDMWENAYKQSEDGDKPLNYEKARNLVPAHVRETLRWRGGCKQVNQVHQMTQRP